MFKILKDSIRHTTMKTRRFRKSAHRTVMASYTILNQNAYFMSCSKLLFECDFR